VIDIETQFDDIYTRYYLAIVRYAISKQYSTEKAEEISQETFERLWRRRTELDFETESALYVWLYKTATLVMMETNKKETEQSDINLCEQYISEENDMGNREERIQYEHYVTAIEKELSDGEKQIFHMVFIDKKEYSYCASKLKMNPSTMRSNISRLRKKLRPYIDKMIKNTE
jgi:RNA polymerase sigma-70 factor (ECF subfamily)